jgi:hypothetical protein
VNRVVREMRNAYLYEATRNWRAVCIERVRHGTHEVNCHHRWPEFRENDSEATNLPEPEKEREQEPVVKAGNSRRHVCCGPATPE